MYHKQRENSKVYFFNVTFLKLVDIWILYEKKEPKCSYMYENKTYFENKT